jgi:hypothetical protein
LQVEDFLVVARFEVHVAVATKSLLFWDIIPSSPPEINYYIACIFGAEQQTDQENIAVLLSS